MVGTVRRRGVDGRDPERCHRAFSTSDLHGVWEQFDSLTGEGPKRRVVLIFALQCHRNTRSFCLTFSPEREMCSEPF